MSQPRLPGMRKQGLDLFPWWKCSVCGKPCPDTYDPDRQGWMIEYRPGRNPDLRCPDHTKPED